MIRSANKKPLFFTWAVVCLVATACSSGGDAWEQDGPCLIPDSHEVGLLDRTPSGRTVEEALSLVMKEHHARLVYERDGTSTDVRIEVSPGDGSILLVRRLPDQSYLVLPETCVDEVRIPARVTFQSGDGAFDEEFEATILVRATSILFDEGVHESEFKGTYDSSWAPLRPGEQVTYYLGGHFEPEGVTGGVRVIASEPYRPGTDLTALFLWIGELSPSGPEEVPPGQEG